MRNNMVNFKYELFLFVVNLTCIKNKSRGSNDPMDQSEGRRREWRLLWPLWRSKAISHVTDASSWTVACYCEFNFNTMIRLALVEFVGEKRRYVVPIADFLTFKPKSCKDFDEEALYDVSWPILRREGSSNSDKAEPFKAKVLLLAGKVFTLMIEIRICAFSF